MTLVVFERDMYVASPDDQSTSAVAGTVPRVLSGTLHPTFLGWLRLQREPVMVWSHRLSKLPGGRDLMIMWTVEQLRGKISGVEIDFPEELPS